MGIIRLRGLWMLCLAGLLLGGCESNQPGNSGSSGGQSSDPGTAFDPGAAEGTGAGARSPSSAEGKAAGSDDGTEAEVVLNSIFYFDFDQAIVKRIGHAELNRHARRMRAGGAGRIRLEGHADERGTREYNLALAERRANAVRSYLVAQGAARSQIEVISYGEEKPVDSGHDEPAWAQNRRVEIVYR